MQHILDLENVAKVSQPFNLRVLRVNMQTLWAILMHLVMDGILCAYVAGVKDFDSLRDRAQAAIQQGKKLYRNAPVPMRTRDTGGHRSGHSGPLSRATGTENPRKR